MESLPELLSGSSSWDKPFVESAIEGEVSSDAVDDVTGSRGDVDGEEFIRRFSGGSPRCRHADEGKMCGGPESDALTSGTEVDLFRGTFRGTRLKIPVMNNRPRKDSSATGRFVPIPAGGRQGNGVWSCIPD